VVIAPPFMPGEPKPTPMPRQISPFGIKAKGIERVIPGATGIEKGSSEVRGTDAADFTWGNNGANGSQFHSGILHTRF
jgi:hypothetical protein